MTDMSEDVMRLERKDTKMNRWIFNISLMERRSAEKLRTILKLKSTGTCLQDNCNLLHKITKYAMSIHQVYFFILDSM